MLHEYTDHEWAIDEAEFIERRLEEERARQEGMGTAEDRAAYMAVLDAEESSGMHDPDHVNAWFNGDEASNE